MKSRRAMPFGAEVRRNGNCRFRLWAPAADAVALRLVHSGVELPMYDEGHGWFGITADAPVGSAYCFVVDRELCVPDPASRAQENDIHGPSLVVDPASFRWSDDDWSGRPLEEAVFYELHVGTFTPEGTFEGVRSRLDYLVDLGASAIELMPVADFPGRWNWGYDGVLPFAPDRSYGHPDDLKALIEAAHAKGLMVILDVVYNHFGPEGNYLHAYAPEFFSRRHRTPWGAAINFDDANSFWVREFFIENAMFWIEEYHLDGLRLDAVHAIKDDSRPDILEALAGRVEERFGGERNVHLTLENDRNDARYIKPRGGYSAQWNDDIHHALHVLSTGEESGYYMDYASAPLEHLGRCLVEGFSYQGERSAYRGGEPRGERTDGLTALGFIGFLQNHDQVGNRAFGERISDLAEPPALQVITALLLLAPSPPLLFMGQEWNTRRPFYFFCDFGPDLAPKVTAGRRREFARFPAFSDPRVRAHIPDPISSETFESARLDWDELSLEEHRCWWEFFRDILRLRRQYLSGRLRGIRRAESGFRCFGETGLAAHWPFEGGDRWLVIVNLGPEPVSDIRLPPGERVFSHPGAAEEWTGTMPPWSIAVLLQGGGGEDEPRFDT